MVSIALHIKHHIIFFYHSQWSLAPHNLHTHGGHVIWTRGSHVGARSGRGAGPYGKIKLGMGQFGDCTILTTLLRLHYSNHTTLTALLQQQYSDSITLTTLLWLHYIYSDYISCTLYKSAELLRQHYSDHTILTTILRPQYTDCLVHYSDYTILTALLWPQYSDCTTLTTPDHTALTVIS